jgi:hypothetical protein
MLLQIKVSVFAFLKKGHLAVEHGWGVTPISGPLNKSGVWGGALGGIVNGDYIMSQSTWVWNIDRYDMVDFVSTGFDQIVLVMTPRPPEVDMKLVLRPFTSNAWIGIGVTFTIIIGSIIVPYDMISYFENTNGYMSKYSLFAFVNNNELFLERYFVASTSTWMFFLLLNAYYGGAVQ